MPAVMDGDVRQVAGESAAIREPSKFQRSIYDHNLLGEGDGVVNAVAGSGKTTTLVGCAQQLPFGQHEKTAFVAFNKHIAVELSGRLPDSVVCSTLHAIAFNVLKSVFDPISPDDWVDGYKYNKLCRTYWKLQGVNTWKNPEIEDGTCEWLRLAMLTRAEVTNAGLLQMAAEYGLNLPKDKRGGRPLPIGDMTAAVSTLLEWGLHGTPSWVTDDRMRFMGARQTISYDDMLHYPLSMGLGLPQMNRLYVDESQDLSRAQRELVMGMRAEGGRMLFVGDPYQSIYGFAGADTGSFHRIKEETGASELPLSICYRCPADHIRLAQEIVPHIEARPDAPSGIVENVKRERVVDRAMEGDMILCRVTAPLIKLAFELIEAGKPAVVRGKEIGKQLGRLIETIARVDNFRFEQFINHANNYKLQQLFILSQKEDNELAVEMFCDRMRTIETLYSRAWQQNVRDERSFRMFCEAMFSDERKCITLATVHKSKGLENPRVFLLQPELMPFPKAKTKQQIEQEWNLRYVALTRAKEALFFVPGE